MPYEEQHLPAEPVTSGPAHHFFGYYEICPWDPTGRYLLAHQVENAARQNTGDDPATVGIIDTQEGNSWKPLTQTYAWSLQQGARLQWLPGSDGQEIIYNQREGNRYVAEILNVRTGAKRSLPLPVHTVSPDGRRAICSNFSRKRAGYGYPGIPDPWLGMPRPQEDGLHVMDLRSGEHRLIVSTREVSELEPQETMGEKKHWLAHLLFNTDGTRFLFHHQWTLKGAMYDLRPITANPDGSDLYVLSQTTTSHYCWYDPTHSMSTLVPREGPRLYAMFTDRTQEREIWGEQYLRRDGHMSFSPDRKWLLTDTYPDQERMQKLLLYRHEEDLCVEIGYFFEPEEFRGPWRCDLHPRWSRDGKKVCFDSAMDGTRQLYVTDVSAKVG